MFRLQMLFDSGETVGSRPVTRIRVVFQNYRMAPARCKTKALTMNFRSSITSLSDWLSTLRHACYRTQRKTRFRLLVRHCRTGFSPAGSLSKVSDSITFHLPPSPSFLVQSPFLDPKTIPVRKAQNWPWSSAGTPSKRFESVNLHPSPVKKQTNWLEWVNQPLSETELEALQTSIGRGRPFGGSQWQQRISKRLGLESSLRPRGRPRKQTK